MHLRGDSSFFFVIIYSLVAPHVIPPSPLPPPPPCPSLSSPTAALSPSRCLCLSCRFILASSSCCCWRCRGHNAHRGQKVTVHCTGYGKNRDLSKKFWSTKDPGQVRRVRCIIFLPALLVVRTPIKNSSKNNTWYEDDY